jgi:hypothetical protein
MIQSVGAASYFLEAAPSLSAIAWDPVTNNPAIGPTERSVQPSITSAARFSVFPVCFIIRAGYSKAMLSGCYGVYPASIRCGCGQRG